MLLVTLVDFDARIIPDAVTIPGTVLAVDRPVATMPLRDAIIGAAVGLFLLWAIAQGTNG